MKVERKDSSVISGAWAKIGDHVLNGDVITFLDAGQMDESGKFGPKPVFKVQLPRDVEPKNLSLNQSSMNNLIEAYGEDTEAWVGKRAKAYVVKQMVSNKMSNVGYFVGSGFALDDNFKLVRTVATGTAAVVPPKPKATMASASDDNLEEIPVVNTENGEELKIEDIPF